MKTKNYIEAYEQAVRELLNDVLSGKTEIEDAVRFLKAKQVESYRNGRNSVSRNSKERAHERPLEDSLPR